jgi:hypothetical protein
LTKNTRYTSAATQIQNKTPPFMPDFMLHSLPHRPAVSSSSCDHRALYELYSSNPHAAGRNVPAWITPTTAPRDSATLTTPTTAGCLANHACAAGA